VRVVVTGATGNVGTGVIRALADEPGVAEVVGVARRRPTLEVRKVSWRTADVMRDDLADAFAGADAVVHLVWCVQPNHRVAALAAANVGGSLRVFDAAAAAGAGTLVVASAFGAYSPGPPGRAADESWPTHGIPTSPYSQQKAYVERVLDAFELAHPEMRVVRFRSALVVRREVGAQAHRLYGGPLVPRALVHPALLVALPWVPSLRTQAVHSSDVGRAYARALVSGARGAFNLAADPPLDGETVSVALGARLLPVPVRAVRGAVAATWRLHLQRTHPEWVDLLLHSPLLDTSRAGAELGWAPEVSATDAVAEFVEGVAEGAGDATAPLTPRRRRL
jgi:nucleoside-diphosphate-sugar epimerase